MKGRNQFTSISPTDRLKQLIFIDEITGCWNFTGTKDKNGYGRFTVKSITRSSRAHRLSYLLFVGNIPEGMCVCHHCDNPSCVNPNHLFLGTIRDNNLDKTIKNRVPKGTDHKHHGTNHPSSKINEETVKSIRKSFDEEHKSLAQLSRDYNLKQGHIRKIIKRITWKWLND